MSRLEPGGTTSNLKLAAGRKRRSHDLGLRSGAAKTTPSVAISNTVAIPGSEGVVTIVLEDDEDAIAISSPRSISQAKAAAGKRPHHSLRVPVLDDEHLELQLGPAGTRSSSAKRKASSSREGLSANAAIDLTDGNEDCELLFTSLGPGKRTQPSREIPKAAKLTCAICMDTMTEETSTVCGHLFCKGCITKAIKEQKKCPTCRKKLTNSQIHRVYLSGSTQ